MVHIFKGNVHHDKKKYVKGQEVPADIVEKMVKQGLAEPIPAPVKPVEPGAPSVEEPRKELKANVKG